MEYFFVEPEVAGEIGDDTTWDRSANPPSVKDLQYIMRGWLGDAILESYPCFIVSKNLYYGILKKELSGVVFDEVDVVVSKDFKGIALDIEIPSFVRMIPVGVAGQDDVAIGNDRRLVVSKNTLAVLKEFGVSHAVIEKFQ